MSGVDAPVTVFSVFAQILCVTAHDATFVAVPASRWSWPTANTPAARRPSGQCAPGIVAMGVSITFGLAHEFADRGWGSGLDAKPKSNATSKFEPKRHRRQFYCQPFGPPAESHAAREGSPAAAAHTGPQSGNNE